MGSGIEFIAHYITNHGSSLFFVCIGVDRGERTKFIESALEAVIGSCAVEVHRIVGSSSSRSWTTSPMANVGLSASAVDSAGVSEDLGAVAIYCIGEETLVAVALAEWELSRRIPPSRSTRSRC
jgi:hypothetical protein